MRYRIVLMGVLGIALIVFAISYFFYRLVFKKDLKQKWINLSMIGLMIVGLGLLYSPVSQYINAKRGNPDRSIIATYNNKNIKTEANTSDRLFLPSAYTSIEATHPSVISFEEKWNGYKYWMAVTPYPKGNAVYENPHVFKSNDLVSWVEDDTNPLDEPISEAFNGNSPMQYDSDTHIIYNKEDKRLEVFWRYVDDVNKKIIIYRRTSENGKTWTPKEIVFEGKKPEEDMLSPALIKDEDGYKLWYVANGYKIWYRESTDGLEWTDPEEIVVPYEIDNMHHWHLDVQETDLGYEMLVVGFEQLDGYNLSDRHVMNLYYSKSKDNKEWDTLKPILFPSQIKNQFDSKGIYRSAMLKEDGQYYIFYSGIGHDDTRGVGLSTGDDIFNLKGVYFSDYSNLYPNE